MTWTAPMTAVAGSLFSAAQWNTFIRDNSGETMPAKATTPGAIFTTSATNQIVERVSGAFLDTQGVNITTTSFGDPDEGSTSNEPSDPGPEVTVTTGVTALVGYRALFRVPSVTARIEVSYEISGATSREAFHSRGLGYSVSNSASGTNLRLGWVDLATLLTPGVNTFTLKYNVSSQTGVVLDRRIWVQPL